MAGHHPRASADPSPHRCPCCRAVPPRPSPLENLMIPAPFRPGHNGPVRRGCEGGASGPSECGGWSRRRAGRRGVTPATGSGARDGGTALMRRPRAPTRPRITGRASCAAGRVKLMTPRGGARAGEALAGQTRRIPAARGGTAARSNLSAGPGLLQIGESLFPVRQRAGVRASCPASNLRANPDRPLSPRPRWPVARNACAPIDCL